MALSSKAWRRTTIVLTVFALAFCSTFGRSSAVEFSNVTNQLTGDYESFPFAQAYSSLLLGYKYANASLHENSREDAQHSSMRNLTYAANDCPKKVRLDVYNRSANLLFSLSGMRCFSVPFLPILRNASGTFFNGSTPPAYIDNRRIMYLGYAKPLLKCSNTSYSQLSAFSLAQQSLTVIYSHLRNISVPLPALESIFGTLNQPEVSEKAEYPSSWNSSFVAEAQAEIRKLLSDFGSVPLLSLGNTKPTSYPTGLHGECFYVKHNHSSPNKTKENVHEILQSLIPVIMTSVMKPLNHSATSLHLVDSKCGTSSGSVANRIDIPDITGPFKSSYEGVLNSTVRIDGVACATAQTVRLLEGESLMKGDELGRKGLEVAEKLKALVEVKNKTKSASEVYLEKNAPEEVVEDLKEAIFKTSIVVARLDLSKCYHVKDKHPVGLLLVDLPTSKFCKSFTTPSIHSSCEELDSDTTAFLTRGKPDEELCLYSSEQPMGVSPHPRPPKPSASSHPTHPPSHRPDQPTRPPHHGPHHSTHPPRFVPRTDHPPHHKPAPKIPQYPRSPSNSFWACFPGEALVALSDGRRVSMQNLRVGDMVEVSPNTFSPVLLFTHALQDITTRMVIIASASGKLAASPTHYIHVNQTLVTAKDVKVGDLIHVKVDEQLRKERVAKISFKHLKGLYNPQTKSGKILVQYGNAAPVVASVYTSAVNPLMAHMLMTPLRWTHSLFGVTIPGVSNFFPETNVEQARGANCIEGESSVPVMKSRGIAAACKIFS